MAEAASPSISSKKVIKQGFLVKQGHVRRNWRTRWFILSKNSLEYYKSKEDLQVKGKVALVGASLDCLRPTVSSKRPWMLRLTTLEGKEYLIGAPDQSTRDEWYLAIEKRILRLDPSKRVVRQKVTLTRSIYNSTGSDEDAERALNRDIVQAMQDRSAGIELHELRRGKHVYRYFNGKEAVDWLIKWMFSSSREHAIKLACDMLLSGFFHPIDVGDRRNGLSRSVIASDKLQCYHFRDAEDAKYIFVAYAPLTLDVMFENQSDDDDDVWIDDSDVGEERGSAPSNQSAYSASNVFDDKIIRQGFLLKKGHFRRNWKTRMFILRDSSPYLCYYKGSKAHRLTRPQGKILLPGCCMTSLDERAGPASPTSVSSPSTGEAHSAEPSPALPTTKESSVGKRRVVYRPNSFCIHTATGVDYFLQAASSEERDAWMADIQQHSAGCEYQLNSTVRRANSL